MILKKKGHCICVKLVNPTIQNTIPYLPKIFGQTILSKQCRRRSVIRKRRLIEPSLFAYGNAHYQSGISTWEQAESAAGELCGTDLIHLCLNIFNKLAQHELGKGPLYSQMDVTEMFIVASIIETFKCYCQQRRPRSDAAFFYGTLGIK